jgi:hypothetical protein
MTMRSADDGAPDDFVALPDLQSLTRLANAMFSALPGAEVTADAADLTTARAVTPPFRSPGASATAPSPYPGSAQHPVLPPVPLEAVPPAAIPLPGTAELRAILAPPLSRPQPGLPALAGSGFERCESRRSRADRGRSSRDDPQRFITRGHGAGRGEPVQGRAGRRRPRWHGLAWCALPRLRTDDGGAELATGSPRRGPGMRSPHPAASRMKDRRTEDASQRDCPIEA